MNPPSTSSNLVELFRQYSDFTDKQSVHAYGRLYEQWLGQLDSVENILELGVSYFGGGSLLAFSDRFPAATIVGCDKTLENIVDEVKARANVHLFCGDVYQKGIAEQFRKDYPQDFNVIIDDAEHSVMRQYMAFLLWSPLVSPQGMYVIEDVCDMNGLSFRLSYHDDQWEILLGETRREFPHQPDSILVMLRRRKTAHDAAGNGGERVCAMCQNTGHIDVLQGRSYDDKVDFESTWHDAAMKEARRLERVEFDSLTPSAIREHEGVSINADTRQEIF